MHEFYGFEIIVVQAMEQHVSNRLHYYIRKKSGHYSLSDRFFLKISKNILYAENQLFQKGFCTRFGLSTI